MMMRCFFLLLFFLLFSVVVVVGVNIHGDSVFEGAPQPTLEIQAVLPLCVNNLLKALLLLLPY
jgi:hypothetical protein